jgi:hypothetical protein
MADSPRMLEMVRRCAKRQRRRAAVHARCRALLRPRPRVRVFNGHSPPLVRSRHGGPAECRVEEDSEHKN